VALAALAGLAASLAACSGAPPGVARVTGIAATATGTPSPSVTSSAPAVTTTATPTDTPSSTPPTTPPTTPAATPTATTPATLPQMLRPGAHGAGVTMLQRRLIDLGYWLPSADGQYGGLTAQAVLALQKAAGLSRDGVFGPRTRAALLREVRPRARSTSGHVIEVDKKRQLLMVVDGGQVRLVLNTSTGSGRTFAHPDGREDVAVTPSGHFTVGRQVDGWRKSDLEASCGGRSTSTGIAGTGSPQCRRSRPRTLRPREHLGDEHAVGGRADPDRNVGLVLLSGTGWGSLPV
jgi:peptidoglycan hydrolase-like protein with peptidoglycan-binding domain